MVMIRNPPSLSVGRKSKFDAWKMLLAKLFNFIMLEPPRGVDLQSIVAFLAADSTA